MQERENDVKKKIEELKQQGIEFHNNPEERKLNRFKRKCCSSNKYIYMPFAVICILFLMFYFLIYSKDKNTFNNGEITISTKFYYNQGIDSDFNIKLLISGNSEDEIVIPANSMMQIIFKSDKYQIVTRSVVFHKKIFISKNKRVPYLFHIKKTEFVKSTKMQIILSFSNFNEEIRLK